MGQQQNHPSQSGNAHSTVRTPTGDARMDADQERNLKSQKDQKERLPGQKPNNVTTDKQHQGRPVS
ncbi:MAG TPA: hypothetical protein VK753_10790 [Xanthomonadaceae bacterium]|nr:hypothetical protein [Xanthomonadaceae bacterium]